MKCEMCDREEAERLRLDCSCANYWSLLHHMDPDFAGRRMTVVTTGEVRLIYYDAEVSIISMKRAILR